MSWSSTPRLGVGERRRLLDAGERGDLRGLEHRPRDREVLDRALRLRAVQGVRGNAHLAHRVVLDAVLGVRLGVHHGVFSFLGAGAGGVPAGRAVQSAAVRPVRRRRRGRPGPPGAGSWRRRSRACPSATASLISSDSASSSATVSRRCSRPTSARVDRRPGRPAARRGARHAADGGDDRGDQAARCAAGAGRRPSAWESIAARDRAALVVAEHQDERHVQHGDRVLERAEHRVGDDLAGVADDEGVAEAQVEDDLGREPGVGAAEDRGERAPGPPATRLAALDVLPRMLRLAGDEALVAAQHRVPDLAGTCRWASTCLLRVSGSGRRATTATVRNSASSAVPNTTIDAVAGRRRRARSRRCRCRCRRCGCRRRPTCMPSIVARARDAATRSTWSDDPAVVGVEALRDADELLLGREQADVPGVDPVGGLRAQLGVVRRPAGRAASGRGRRSGSLPCACCGDRGVVDGGLRRRSGCRAGRRARSRPRAPRSRSASRRGC